MPHGFRSVIVDGKSSSETFGMGRPCLIGVITAYCKGKTKCPEWVNKLRK